MKVKIAMLLMVFCFQLVMAHEDHGPRINDGGKYGGVVAAVVNENDAKKDVVYYKAELVRSDDGTVRLYLFNKEMKLVDYSSFAKKINANVEVMKNKKSINKPFTLDLHGNHYMGVAPKPEKKPFNIDVQFEHEGKKLFIGFSNLD